MECCAAPLAATAAGVVTLLVTRILLGAAEGPAYPVANHAAHKWFPHRSRDLVSGILTIGAPLGVIAAVPFVAWIIAGWGWRAAFAVLGVIGLGWAVLWLILGREGPLLDEPAETVPPDGADGPAPPNRISTFRVLRSGTWLAAVAGGFAGYWSLSLLIAWVPPYLTKVLGLQGEMASLATVLPWAFMSVAMLGQGLLIRRLTKRGVPTRYTRGVFGGICVVATGLATAVFVLTDLTWLKITALTIGFSLGSLIIAIGQAVCAEISPSNRRGGVLGAFAAVYSLAGVIAPAVTGGLVSSAATPATGYHTSFLITAALLIVCGVLVIAFVRPATTRQRLLQP